MKDYQDKYQKLLAIKQKAREQLASSKEQLKYSQLEENRTRNVVSQESQRQDALDSQLKELKLQNITQKQILQKTLAEEERQKNILSVIEQDLIADDNRLQYLDKEIDKKNLVKQKLSTMQVFLNKITDLVIDAAAIGTVSNDPAAIEESDIIGDILSNID